MTVPDRSSPMPVEAVGLTKSLGRGDSRVPVLRGLDLDVGAGEVVALLGPNGAGKTTTVRILSTLTRPDGGTARVGGFDVVADRRRVREIISLTGQYAAVDDKLTGRENLRMMGRLAHHPRRTVDHRVDELLLAFDLTDAADRLVATYSGGMRRRLDLAAGLLDRPVVLFLDEPTTGLDPQARHVLWDRLFRLKEEGTTLVLTTHYMDEAEQLCDRLVVVDKGRIVAEGGPSALIRQYSTREVLEVRFGSAKNAAAATAIEGIGDRIEVLPDRVLVYADDGEAAMTAVHERGLQPITSLVRRSSLEDVFLRLTGRSLID